MFLENKNDLNLENTLFYPKEKVVLTRDEAEELIEFFATFHKLIKVLRCEAEIYEKRVAKYKVLRERTEPPAVRESLRLYLVFTPRNNSYEFDTLNDILNSDESLYFHFGIY